MPATSHPYPCPQVILLRRLQTSWGNPCCPIALSAPNTWVPSLSTKLMNTGWRKRKRSPDTFHVLTLGWEKGKRSSSPCSVALWQLWPHVWPFPLQASVSFSTKWVGGTGWPTAIQLSLLNAHFMLTTVLKMYIHSLNLHDNPMRQVFIHSFIPCLRSGFYKPSTVIGIRLQGWTE